jgi:hypothetical protein
MKEKPNLRMRFLNRLKRNWVYRAEDETVTIFAVFDGRRQIDDIKGIPFEVKIPNEETQKVIRNSRKGINVTTHTSLDDYFEKKTGTGKNWSKKITDFWDS